MARHRNVRSMNYADEYDFDDVYGHSVEDDYSISPSDAAYVFDRNNQKAQISAFLTGDEDIAEEDENAEEAIDCAKRRDSDTLGLRIRNLSELDEARLRSCLDEIRNVIGDSVTEASLADIIVANDFDVAKSLNSALSNATEESKKPPLKMKKQETPLTQREPRVHPAFDYKSTTMLSLKEGVRSLDLDAGAGLPKFCAASSKPPFKVPKLSKPITESDKENALVERMVPVSGLTGNLQSVDRSDVAFNFGNAPKVPPGLKPLNFPSCAQNSNKLPVLKKESLPKSNSSFTDSNEELTSLTMLIAQHSSSKLGLEHHSLPLAKSNLVPPLFKNLPETDDKNEDSEEEGSSLSALIAQHASKMAGPEHTTLSALADFHLKGNVSQSEFVIPCLKSLPKPNLISQISGGGHNDEKLGNLNEERNFSVAEDGDLYVDQDSFVIDLRGALNPPDFRKQLERPQSRMKIEDSAGHDGNEEGQDDSKPWIQDTTCVLDARAVLCIDFPMELKSSSPVGRILCRRRFVRKVPYVRPTSPFIGNIVPFAFDTPSPDALVQKHLRRL